MQHQFQAPGHGNIPACEVGKKMASRGIESTWSRCISLFHLSSFELYRCCGKCSCINVRKSALLLQETLDFEKIEEWKAKNPTYSVISPFEELVGSSTTDLCWKLEGMYNDSVCVQLFVRNTVETACIDRMVETISDEACHVPCKLCVASVTGYRSQHVRKSCIYRGPWRFW